MSTQKFSTIPTRSNADEVRVSWWNLLQQAGLRLEEIFGTALIGETQQSVSDGQSATSITGLLFVKTTHVGAKIHITSKRDDGTNQRRHIHELTVWYNGKRDLWGISNVEIGESCTSGACTDVASGLTFSITSGGQVQVAANTMGGSHVGSIRWKVISSFSVES